MHARSSKTLAAAVLTAALVVAPAAASLATPSSANASAQQQAQHLHSDADILLATLFGTGPLAAQLGISVHDQVDVPADYDALARASLQQFTDDNPSDVDTALNEIRTGNPVRVHEAVAALQASFASYYEFTETRSSDGALCASINLVLAGNLAVFINVGVAVAVVWVAYVVTYQASDQGDAQLLSARLGDAAVE